MRAHNLCKSARRSATPRAVRAVSALMLCLGGCFVYDDALVGEPLVLDTESAGAGAPSTLSAGSTVAGTPPTISSAGAATVQPAEAHSAAGEGGAWGGAVLPYEGGAPGEVGAAGAAGEGSAAGASSWGVFRLINASTERPIAAHSPMKDDARVSMSKVDTTNLNLVFEPAPELGVTRVVFDFDTTVAFHAEVSAPFTLGGDQGPDYLSLPIPAGEHTVTAHGYAGVELASQTIHFQIIP